MPRFILGTGVCNGRVPHVTSLLGLVILLGSAPADAGDASAGRAKAAACIGCHGEDGNSSNPQWPKLAGQHAAYLATAMRAYRSGARRDAIMRAMVRPLSDEDIADLAAWFASQKQR